MVEVGAREGMERVDRLGIETPEPSFREVLRVPSGSVRKRVVGNEY